jgi:hypothetical protein
MLRISRGRSGRRSSGARAETSRWGRVGFGLRLCAARQSRAAGKGFTFEGTSRRRRGFAALTVTFDEASFPSTASFRARAAQPRLSGLLARKAQHFAR